MRKQQKDGVVALTTATVRTDQVKFYHQIGILIVAIPNFVTYKYWHYCFLFYTKLLKY